MAAVRGPLFSFDASGALADTLVFSKWKGRPYVRQLVIPSNPDSLLQRTVRSVMRFVSQYWSTLTAPQKSAWDTEGESDNITGLNAWARDAQSRRKSGDAITRDPNPVADTTPGPPTAPAAVGGPGQIELTWVNAIVGTLFTTQIHRGTTGFTPGPNNVDHILPSTTLTVTLTNLTAGTYFLKIRHGSVKGVIGTSSTEVSAVVT